MNDRETLERMLRDESPSFEEAYGAAIRAVLASYDEIAAALTNADKKNVELLKENERLRAALEDRVKVVAEHRKVIIEQSGRIHAALAIAERLKEREQPFAGLGVALVRALKGEA